MVQSKESAEHLKTKKDPIDAYQEQRHNLCQKLSELQQQERKSQGKEGARRLLRILLGLK
jgi:hypothetical protein